MSKCIDTIGGGHPFETVRDWIFRLFRGDVMPRQAATSGDAEPSNPAPAPAMLMASRDIGPIITRTAERVADWQARRASRRQLLSLDDRLLKDIGISRCDAELEYKKPFWRE